MKSSLRQHSGAFSRALALALAVPLNMSARPLLRVPVGTTLQHSGDYATRLVFLASGRIDAVLYGNGSDGGAPVVPLVFGAGEIVLLSQLFCESRSGVELFVSDDAALRWVLIDEIEVALLKDRDAMLLLVKFLAQRLCEVPVRERAWVERGVHERVCAALARLAAEQPLCSDGRCLIAITHEQFASRCGVSRPKASTALKRLEQAGHLRLDRGLIEVLTLPGLA